MPTSDAYEWLDGNMHRSYPIGDSCTCVSSSGIMLPSSFLVDIDITVPQLPENNWQERFYISGIARSGDSFTVEISYQAVNGSFLCARSAPIDMGIRNSLPITDRTFTLNSVTTTDVDHSMLNELEGSLIVGSCIDMLEIGNLTFPYTSGGQQVASLLSVRIHKSKYGLDAVTFQNNATAAINMSRSFTIKAGDGVEFEAQQVDGEDVIVVKRTQSSAEYISNTYGSADALVADILAKIGQPILRINGIAPDGNGNFVMAGDDCTTITPAGAGLFIQNPCAKPCCDETTPLDAQASIETIEQGIERLQTYYEALSTAINSMQAKLASLIVAGR